MNKAFLIGNLTRDPEYTTTSSAIALCKFSIAVSRDYANEDGNRDTDYFNIVVWRKKAETCGKYLKKGNKVAVVGTLQNRSYEDKDGIKRTVTDVIASDVEFLTSKQSNEEHEEVVSASMQRRPQLEEIDDNQLPF